VLLGNLFEHRHKPEVLIPGVFVKSLTYVGVELEFSSLGDHVPQLTYWTWHSDGSIRGERTGELVLHAPTTPLEFDEAVNEYYAKVARDVAVNGSCGMHVHIDVCDLTVDELRGVLLFYSVLERTLYKYCGDGRDGNNFCVPLWECWDKVGWLGKNFTVDNSLRYCGLNLAAIRKFGSIEFRMHPGVVDAGKMARWVGLCARIKEYGRTCTVDSVYNLLQSTPSRTSLEQVTGTREFLSSTLGDSAHLLVPYCDREDLFKGAVDGKEVYFSSSLRASNKRLARTPTKRAVKSLYIPYNVWQGEV